MRKQSREALSDTLVGFGERDKLKDMIAERDDHRTTATRRKELRSLIKQTRQKWYGNPRRNQ